MSLHALVIDADDLQRDVVRVALSRDGWSVREARSLAEAGRVISSHKPALVFCEMGEGGEAACLLRELESQVGDGVPIIMMSANATPHQVLDAIINGAYDLLHKPCREADILDRARFVIRRAFEAEKEVKARLQTVSNGHTAESVTADFELVGRSAAITAVTSELAKALRDDHVRAAGSEKGTVCRPPTFFITGETGTGKELVARSIHAHSRFREGPFVAINCSTLHAELADAQLFGSSPGAFTGALKHEHAGLWEGAAGGTLFLDEITEAPTGVLPKMLRVLQFGEFTPLGSKRIIKVAVQVVAASNRDIRLEIQAGRFREDLYHRLSLYRVHVPPLRVRLDDVPPLVEHFAKMYGTGRVRFSRGALELLQTYEWRGNVRELENIVRRAIAHAHDRTVYAVDLAPHLPAKDETNSLPSVKRESSIEAGEGRTCICDKDNRGGLNEQMRRFRNSVVKETLDAHNNCRTRSAKSLQISRSKMHRIIDELE